MLTIAPEIIMTTTAAAAAAVSSAPASAITATTADVIASSSFPAQTPAEALISPFETYLILQLDDVNIGLNMLLSVLLSVFISLLVAFPFIYFGCGPDEYDYDKELNEKKIDERERIIATLKKALKCVFPACCVVFLLTTFMPSSKTMIATYLLPPIVNNQEVQKIPEEVLGMLRGLIKEWPEMKVRDGRRYGRSAKSAGDANASTAADDEV